jgi:hypothetical protein
VRGHDLRTLIARVLALLAAGIVATGCGHATRVRPTPAGQLEASLEFGGPIGRVEGYPLPLPLATFGASYGITDRADAFVGVHLTPLLFGVVGLDLGGDFMPLMDQGPWPALNLTGRAYLFSTGRTARPYLEVDATFSKRLADRFVTFVSGQSMLQFSGGPPLFGLSAGEELVLDAWSIQLEARWYEPGYDTVGVPTEWWSIGGTGSFGMMLGVRRRFGVP